MYAETRSGPRHFPTASSTAQPPRDFYLYFLQPHNTPYFKDEKNPDEVFFKFKHRDDDFDAALKRYAGAYEQAATASGENKRIYEQKASDHLRSLTQWLREHMTTAFEVTYEGRAKTLQAIIQGKFKPVILFFRAVHLDVVMRLGCGSQYGRQIQTI